MIITPEQADAITVLCVRPDDEDARAACDVQVSVDAVEWLPPYRAELPSAAIYVRVAWTPDPIGGLEDATATRYSRTWLLDSAGDPMWTSTPQLVGAF